MLTPEKVFIILVFLQNVIPTLSYEYCSEEEKLCKDKRHIVCYPEQIEPESDYIGYFPITGRFMNWILYWHNNYRNQLACGDIEGSGGKLPAASRMREVIWDYELAYIARVHAQRCRMQHDECRNTHRIPTSGQNLAFAKTDGEPEKALDRGFKSITDWFEEYKFADKALLEKGGAGGAGETGHFTAMSHEKVGRVGCAMTACKTNESSFNYFTCNYDYTNVEGVPVYVFGDAASDCGHWNRGQSSNFSCLCKSSFGWW